LRHSSESENPPAASANPLHSGHEPPAVNPGTHQARRKEAMSGVPKGLYWICAFLLLYGIGIAVAEVMYMASARWLTLVYSVAYAAVAVGLLMRKSMARLAALCLIFPVLLLTGLVAPILIVVNLLGNATAIGIAIGAGDIALFAAFLVTFRYLRRDGTRHWYDGEAGISPRKEWVLIAVTLLVQIAIASIDFLLLYFGEAGPPPV
jgi:hypothetical protein